MEIHVREVCPCELQGGWHLHEIYATKKLGYFAMRHDLVERFNRAREEWFRYGRSLFVYRGNKHPYRQYEAERIRTLPVITGDLP